MKSPGIALFLKPHHRPLQCMLGLFGHNPANEVLCNRVLLASVVNKILRLIIFILGYSEQAKQARSERKAQEASAKHKNRLNSSISKFVDLYEFQ